MQELQALRDRAERAEQTLEEQNRRNEEGQRVVDELAFNEAETRRLLIDTALEKAGWDVSNTDEVKLEFEVEDQPTSSGKGYVDYVLWDDNGMPLAVIEAKKTSKSPEEGRKQAKLYADALENKYQQRPVIFYTNGYETKIWDDRSGRPGEAADGYAPPYDLGLLLQRLTSVHHGQTSAENSDPESTYLTERRIDRASRVGESTLSIRSD